MGSFYNKVKAASVAALAVVGLAIGAYAETYIITAGSGNTFKAQVANTIEYPALNIPMDDVLAAVREHAKGANVTIQLGDDTGDLNSTVTVDFNNDKARDVWGKITLTGNLISNRASASTANGSVAVRSGIEMENTANIRETNLSSNNRNVSIIVSQNAQLTHSSGTVGVIAVHNEGASEEVIIVSGGKVESISTSELWNGTVTISGGEIGSADMATSAITNSGTGKIVISGGAVSSAVISDSNNRGTVTNRGSGIIEITGGNVSNENNSNSGGVAVINQSIGTVNISGGLVTSKAASGFISAATVVNSGTGNINISGEAEIENVSYGDGTVAVRNTLTGTVSIFGNAKVISANPSLTSNIRGTVNGSGGGLINISDNGTVENRAALGSALHVSSSTANINGGTVISNGNNAIYAHNASEVTISGSANITAATTGSATIFCHTRNVLNLFGGKITNTAENGDAIAHAGATQGSSALTRMYIGGAPEINGNIYVSLSPTGIADGEIFETITEGANAFAPGGRIYRLITDRQLGDYFKITNAAGFMQNFSLTSVAGSIAAGNAAFKLAASGNDIVVTNGNTIVINFRLNGAVNANEPPSLVAVAGTKLGPLAMPRATGYGNANGFASDGKWYMTTGQTGGVWEKGNEFVFSLSDGTVVTESDGLPVMNLILGWSNNVSVRNLQFARGSVSPLVSVRAKNLNISADNGTQVHVKVLSLSGKTVADFRSSGNATHSLRRLPAGAYIVDAKRADGYRMSMPITLR